MAVLYVLFTSLSLSFSISFHWPFYRGVPTTAITGPRLPLHEISTGLFIRTACDVTNQFFPFHNTQLRSLSHGRDSVSVQNTKHGSSSLSWIMSSDNDKSLSLSFSTSFLFPPTFLIPFEENIGGENVLFYLWPVVTQQRTEWTVKVWWYLWW